ncbi:MAG: enoyl-CoA hydratase/isomerase family protein [Phycisphaerales bacterium]|nr:enoyl-CoA hydratase/isomerase family protein [Phycisphaerales bacterium]
MIVREHRGGVALIRLSRPDQRNALTPGAMADLVRAVRETTAGSLVLAGDGPVFCAGFDLKRCAEDAGAMPALLRGLSEAVIALRALPGPVVVAAHGAAIAGGCALLGGADVVVADRGCRLGYPVVRIGVSPAVSAPFLRGAVGDGPARAGMLDPGLVSGDEAARLGLVHELVESPDLVMPRALELAAALAAKPPWAVAATRAWLREIEDAEAGAERGLAASMSLVNGEEERRLLAAAVRRP